MTNNKFTKTPISKEKERKAEAFLNFEEKPTEAKSAIPKKEPTKNLYLRVPNSYWENIQKIMSLTGLSMNSTCLELLRPAIKDKLKELTEE